MKLGEKTINEILEQVEHLTRAWLTNLDDAFKKFGGAKFPVTYKTMLDVGKGGGIKVKTTITFRPEPYITDTAEGTVDEEQLTLAFSSVTAKTKPIDRRGPVGRPSQFKALGG